MLADLISSHLPAGVSQWAAPIHSWKEGVTPMSTLTSVNAASVSYVVVVLGGQALMRHFSPVPAHLVKWPFFFHNLLLSLASLVLLVLYLEKELGFIGKRGLHDALCYGPHFHDVEMYHILNYYFKYWEFIDTFFLVIKKKKLMFLHVYHHMATAALCYSQIVNETTLSWVIISLNLAVHVIMYGYYAMASVGIRCPWKKWITTGQIIQFIIDVAVCVYGSTYLLLTQSTTTTPPSMRAGSRMSATATADHQRLLRAWRSWQATCSYLLFVRMCGSPQSTRTPIRLPQPRKRPSSGTSLLA